MSSSNPFSNFVVIPRFSEGHILQWKLDPLFQIEKPYCFSIQAAHVPDFSTIAYELPATYDFLAIDNSNTVQTWVTNLWYRVKLKTEDNEYYSNVLTLGATRESRYIYQLAAEITRKELLRMRKYTGQEGFVLKKKLFDAPPEEIVDPITRTAITLAEPKQAANISEQYYPPIAVLYSMEHIDQDKHLSEEGFGTIENITANIRMVGYPSLDVYDVIVDRATDQRYVIRRKKSSCFPGTNIELIQVFTAMLMPPTDDIYQLDLPIDYEPLHR